MERVKNADTDQKRDWCSHKWTLHFEFRRNVFASLFCTSTAFHEHVGQVSDYYYRPDFVGATMREGKKMDSIQTYILLSTLLCSTGLRVPSILGNFEHLLQRDRYAPMTVPVLRKFRRDLFDLSDKIDRLNLRKGRYQLQSFNPYFLESSVSL